MHRTNRAPMPADLRARLIPPPREWRPPAAEEFHRKVIASYETVPEPSRARVALQRVLAVGTFGMAFVFAGAAAGLAHSRDPITALAPLAGAVFMGWAAREIWPPRTSVLRFGSDGVRVGRPRPRVGLERDTVSATGRQAPVVTER